MTLSGSPWGRVGSTTRQYERTKKAQRLLGPDTNVALMRKHTHTVTQQGTSKYFKGVNVRNMVKEGQ